MFTTAERNLMTLYNPGTRLGLISELEQMLGCLTEEETELRELTLSVIKKLEKMTDAAFDRLPLDPMEQKGW